MDPRRIRQLNRTTSSHATYRIEQATISGSIIHQHDTMGSG